MRFRVDPRDVPPDAAALPNLVARGFPKADPDTGNHDLDAIDRWCDARHPHLFGGAAPIEARKASAVVKDRLAAMKASHG
jgi:hypothetical protein